MGYIAGCDRNQITLMPECIDDFITEDNPVRIIDAFVVSLNMKELKFEKAEPAKTGRPPYDPKDILKLYIYGYMNRIRSSRRLESEAQRNLEVIWLLKKLTPDFKTVADFRKENKTALKLVFKKFTLLCKDWDLFGKELVAVDGSKFRASNSKRNNFSEKKLDRHIKYIEEKIDKYMKETDKNDLSEARGRRPDAQEIQRRITELKERKELYEGYRQEIREGKVSEVSTIDKDARLMGVNNNGIDVCYNVQTAVDSKNKLVVDFEVINNPSDQGQLSEMSTRAKEIFEVEKLEALADKGYYSAADLKKCEEKKITTYVAKQTHPNRTGDTDFYPDKFTYNKESDTYICPRGERLCPAKFKKPKEDRTSDILYKNPEACQKCEFKDRCTKSKSGRFISRHIDQDFLDNIDERTSESKNKYKLRQMIVEHPFGTVKRGFGYYYVLTRGIESVRAEMSLSFLAYNLKRVINILGFKILNEKLAVL